MLDVVTARRCVLQDAVNAPKTLNSEQRDVIQTKIPPPPLGMLPEVSDMISQCAVYVAAFGPAFEEVSHCQIDSPDVMTLRAPR